MEISRQVRRVNLATAVAALAIAFLSTSPLASPLEASAQSRNATKGVAVVLRKKLHHKHVTRQTPRPTHGRTGRHAPATTATGSGGAGGGTQPAPAPSTPSPPSQPTAPSHPTKPSKPSQPSQPAEPSQPTEPSPPTEPSQPSGPPQPTPPIGPGEPSSGSVLFRGDQIRDFAVAQSARGAMTEVTDPAGSGETVFKFTVSDNDGYPVTPTENPRAELISPYEIESGDEFWVSAKFFLPADFPVLTPNFVTLMQVFGPPANGSPPFHIEAKGGVLKWQRNATYGWDIPWQMPEIRNQWVNVLVHYRFARDGWVEMWINGQQVTFFGSGSYNPRLVAPTTRLEMETMDSSNSGAPNAVFIQQYRKKGMYPSLTVYQGPLTIGSSRASVGG